MFLFIFSCNEQIDANREKFKIERIEFTINDSFVHINEIGSIIFYFPSDSVFVSVKKDSIRYPYFENSHANMVKIIFRVNQFSLEFDSIPMELLFQKQHTKFSFGIRDTPLYSDTYSSPKMDTNQLGKTLFQFLEINPWDSGTGRYFERPYYEN